MFYKIFDELSVQKVDIFSLEDKEILEILLGAVNNTIKELDTDTWSRMMYYIVKHMYPMYNNFKYVLFENRFNFEFWIDITLWPKEKAQKVKQRPTKHTHKTNDRATRTPLNPVVNSGAPEGYAVLDCSISDTRRVNLVANSVISHEWGKHWEVFMTSGTYPGSFVTQIFHKLWKINK